MPGTKEKGWIATIIDAAAGKAADTAVEKATDSAKQQVKYELQAVEKKVDAKVDEVTSGDKSKYLVLASFLMSALGLGLEIWNMHSGSKTSQTAPTVVNVYYGSPNRK